ncbi:putative 5'-nucleotidase-like [Apostichopus japonicus]|uniref:5'-nucleotidase n=1 Tax=Stichopus japonicus TaxID=307972 RepID=A0A2G8JW80_STIJA|nr:putative 5'-nucleotidase-like [Apostichopus japonicus]
MEFIRSATFLCSLFLASFVTISEANFNLTILHTNDEHSRFDEFGPSDFDKCTKEFQESGACYGGIARRVSAVKDIRKETGNVILLDAGDRFQGTAWYNYYRGSQTALFMNNMSYDAIAIGTHDFDVDVEGLANFLESLTFPALGCNVDATNESLLDNLIPCSTVLNISGELVGIVGYTHPANKEYSRTGNLEIAPVIESLQEEVDRLTNQQGVTKIIAVGHAGISIDQEIAQQQIPSEANALIGCCSTSHGEAPSSEVPYGDYPIVVTPDSNPEGKVLVVSAYRFGKYLGRLDVEFDDQGQVQSYNGNPLLLGNHIEKDVGALETLNNFRGPVDELMASNLAYSMVTLDGSINTCGRGECNMGIHFAEAMLNYQLSNESFPGWTQASIALYNADSFRISLPQGYVTYQDVLDVIPYGDTIDVIELRGADVILVLEVSVTNLEADGEPSGGFLQTAGIRIIYDLTKPAGERVVSVKVLCTACDIPRYEPIDDDMIYKIVTNNYIATGGTGYGIIPDMLISRVKGADDVDVWSDYFRSKSPVWTAVEERVTFQEDSKCNNGGQYKLNWVVSVFCSALWIGLTYRFKALIDI